MLKIKRYVGSIALTSIFLALVAGSGLYWRLSREHPGAKSPVRQTTDGVQLNVLRRKDGLIRISVTNWQQGSEKLFERFGRFGVSLEVLRGSRWTEVRPTVINDDVGGRIPEDWILLDCGDEASWLLDIGKVDIGDSMRITWKPSDRRPPKEFVAYYGDSIFPKKTLTTEVIVKADPDSSYVDTKYFIGRY